MRAPATSCIALALCSVVVACRSVEEKFQSKERADIGSFSEQTTVLLRDYEPTYADLDLVRARSLLDPAGAEERALLELAQRVRRGTVVVIEFSHGIADLATLDGDEQVDRFSDLFEGVVAHFEAGGGELDAESALEAVRRKENLREALLVSIPVMRGAMRHGLSVFDEIEGRLRALFNKLEVQIDDRYAATLARSVRLESDKEELLTALDIVRDARHGADDARDRLSMLHVVDRIGGVDEGDAGLQDLARRLIDNLEWVDRIEASLERNVNEYRQAHQELDRVHLVSLERLKRERVRFLIWTRGYERMAKGVVEPAEWFDISDAPAFLIDAAQKSL